MENQTHNKVLDTNDTNLVEGIDSRQQENLDGLLERILVSQFDSKNNMLYVEIIHLLTAECKREVLAQQSIYLMAQIIHSLENGCTVWTLYEVFIQADDPAVDEAHREHLFMRYRGPNINRAIFQKVLFFF